MQIYQNASLKPFHTFSIETSCEFLVIVESVDELISVYKNSDWKHLPKLVLGKGSNVLFTEHYEGVVVINRINGKKVVESEQAFHLHIKGGEDWPELVKWSTENGYSGLENLALIPGCAGSAPIQNIGAYGNEFKDFCEYVDVLWLEDFAQQRLTAEECQFGYRDSIFKREYQDKCVIVAVGLKLSKTWSPNTSYGPLQAIPQSELTPKRIFDEVCKVRMEKLPDPAKTGNAGSFFKNPVIEKDHFERLKQSFPNIVGYANNEKVKVAAGWLIDQCGFKGVSQNGAQVHPNQALVLVNKDNASAKDVIELAGRIVSEVSRRYGINLEHEVRFMNSSRETKLSECMGRK
ncbi:UDP-N-acetylmuramate dehydrogenase [Vibrio hannami]|uniref:UDP-N-acetylmuramate dehydrogenase n=1 Tax=Vibrio hannami TaxID=2717094 RepID=UPI00240F4584|nr:UDP-N-acetylmuramate dehydrogenase [Vibrio hannami]MDG3084593.1 UDP-N-acetylmuramate dehydrogenase [Vibrio hannami]